MGRQQKYLALGDSMSIDDYTGVEGGGAANQFARTLGEGWTLDDRTYDGCWMADGIALAAAKGYGIPIVLGTDAHAADELRFMEFGVYQARRAGLEAAQVANTRSLAQFRRLLKC